jgi:hypothetical protein
MAAGDQEDRRGQQQSDESRTHTVTFAEEGVKQCPQRLPASRPGKHTFVSWATAHFPTSADYESSTDRGRSQPCHSIVVLR